MKILKFQNLSKEDGKVCTEDTMTYQLGMKNCASDCTGPVTVLVWVPFLLSRLSTTHPLTLTLLPQKQSQWHQSHSGLWIHFQTPSLDQTELSCKHPGLGSPGVSTRISPFEGDTQTLGHRSLHHCPIFYRLFLASVQWGQRLTEISPPTLALK